MSTHPDKEMHERTAWGTLLLIIQTYIQNIYVRAQQARHTYRTSSYLYGEVTRSKGFLQVGNFQAVATA